MVGVGAGISAPAPMAVAVSTCGSPPLAAAALSSSSSAAVMSSRRCAYSSCSTVHSSSCVRAHPIGPSTAPSVPLAARCRAHAAAARARKPIAFTTSGSHRHCKLLSAPHTACRGGQGAAAGSRRVGRTATPAAAPMPVATSRPRVMVFIKARPRQISPEARPSSWTTRCRRTWPKAGRRCLWAPGRLGPWRVPGLGVSVPGSVGLGGRWVADQVLGKHLRGAIEGVALLAALNEVPPRHERGEHVGAHKVVRHAVHFAFPGLAGRVGHSDVVNLERAGRLGEQGARRTACVRRGGRPSAAHTPARP